MAFSLEIKQMLTTRATNKSCDQMMRYLEKLVHFSHTDRDIWEVVTWYLFLLPLQTSTSPVNSSGYAGWPNQSPVSCHWCELLWTWRMFAVLNLFCTYSISGVMYVCTNMQYSRVGLAEYAVRYKQLYLKLLKNELNVSDFWERIFINVKIMYKIKFKIGLLFFQA